MTIKKQIIDTLKIILILFGFIDSFAQSETEADSLLKKASVEMYSHPELSEKIARMVYESNHSEEKKMEALFILSNVDYMNANYKSSLVNLYAIETFLKNSKRKDYWKVKVNFLLSDIYRQLQTPDLAESHFQIATNEFHNMRSVKQRRMLTELYDYENALYELEKGNYKRSSYLFKKSLNKFSFNDSHSSIQYLSYIKLADNYIRDNKPDSALMYLSKVPEQYDILYARSCLGMAEIEFSKRDWESAKQYLLKSKSLLTNSSDALTLKNIYSLFSRGYIREGNIEKHEFYKQKNDSIENKINQNIDLTKNYVLTHIEQENRSVKEDENSYLVNAILIVIGLMTILFIPVLIYYIKTKSDYRKYQELMKGSSPQEIPLEREKEKVAFIPEKSEQILLKKLSKFEESENYLNSNISLVSLAKQLDTNTKYLSEVINRNKKKHFNSYINELRINYIVRKLKTENKYRFYKISYLAEESGYSSHSVFTTAFKSVTGISPTSFISFLKKDRE